MNTNLDWYSIHPEELKDAYDKGVMAARGVRIDTRKDDYGNFCFPHLTLTGQLARNPYTVTGSGKKLKSAWHNGFLSKVKEL